MKMRPKYRISWTRALLPLRKARPDRAGRRAAQVDVLWEGGACFPTRVADALIAAPGAGRTALIRTEPAQLPGRLQGVPLCGHRYILSNIT